MTTTNETKRKFLGWRFGGNIQTDDPTQLDASVDILEEVLIERNKQIEQWGDDYDLSQHELLSIATEEIGEVAKDINDINIYYKRLQSYTTLNPAELLERGWSAEILEENIERLTQAAKEKKENLRYEWVQLAAVAVKAIEIFDKQQVE